MGDNVDERLVEYWERSRARQASRRRELRLVHSRPSEPTDSAFHVDGSSALSGTLFDEPPSPPQGRGGIVLRLDYLD